MRRSSIWQPTVPGNGANGWRRVDRARAISSGHQSIVDPPEETRRRIRDFLVGVATAGGDDRT
jgi:hypothetical protein